MEEQQIGWIAAIIIGGIAGWLAEQFMKSQMGLVMNIVLGIIGAAVASWLFGFLGISFGGWIGYLIAGFIGACILIAIARQFSGGLQQRTGKPGARRERPRYRRAAEKRYERAAAHSITSSARSRNASGIASPID